MKKIIISLTVLAAAAGIAFAQPSIDAGYLYSINKATIGSSVVDAASQGFFAGVSYTYPITTGFDLNAGLYYNYLTTSDSDSANIIGDISGSYDLRMNEHYISLPVNMRFGATIADGVKIFAFAGPSLSYCIASNTKYDASVNLPVIGNISKEGVINNFEVDEDYKPFDVMVGGGLGTEIQGVIRIQAGYRYGLLDRDAGENSTLHRSEIFAGVSFIF